MERAKARGLFEENNCKRMLFGVGKDVESKSTKSKMNTLVRDTAQAEGSAFVVARQASTA